MKNKKQSKINEEFKTPKKSKINDKFDPLRKNKKYYEKTYDNLRINI